MMNTAYFTRSRAFSNAREFTQSAGCKSAKQTVLKLSVSKRGDDGVVMELTVHAVPHPCKDTDIVVFSKEVRMTDKIKTVNGNLRLQDRCQYMYFSISESVNRRPTLTLIRDYKIIMLVDLLHCITSLHDVSTDIVNSLYDLISGKAHK